MHGELHPHMHRDECSVCLVLRAVVALDPIETSGRPGGEPVYRCRWCAVRQPTYAPGADVHTHHDSECAYWTACALLSIDKVKR